jgi:hypothetical protein
VSSHVSLFMNTGHNPCPYPEKNSHQNIRCERRQKNEDGIWIHVSLFYPDQGKDLSQHSQTARHESL